MTVEQAYALTNLAMQLAVLYMVGAVVSFGVAIFVLGTIITAALGVLDGERSNCMYEAYRHYRRGAYVIMRKTRQSRGWRWPHMGWSYDGKIWYEYVPNARPVRWLPPLLFKGHIRTWTPE
jgi:hypothetical protein